MNADKRRWNRSELSVFICVHLWLFTTAVLAASDPPEYTRAAQLVSQQQWREAQEQIEQLARAYPNNPKVLNLKGLALAGAGDIKGAIAAFQAALAASPAFGPALKNLGIIEWNDGRKTEAAGHIAAALALNPRDPVLNAYAALGDMERGDTQGAAAHFDSAGEARAALDPRLEAKLAAFFGQHGRYSQAQTAFADVIRRGYDNATVRYDLALAQFLDGKYKAAVATLEPLRESSASSDALNLLAQAYERDHATQKAIDALRQAISAYPDEENNYLDLANICLDHDSYALGREVVEIGLKRLPASARLQLQLGLLDALSGDYSRAQAEFEAAARLEPASDLPSAATQLATIQQSRLPDAIRGLRQELSRNGQSAVLWYLLGAALIRNGRAEDQDEAVSAFKKATQFDPKLPYPYIELGKIYVQQKEFARAIPVLERAAELAPGERASYYQLAIAYRATGQPEQAARMLAKVKQMLKDDRETAAYRVPLEKR
jgi:tetratricopeptide (TPR) repeat protein